MTRRRLCIGVLQKSHKLRLPSVTRHFQLLNEQPPRTLWLDGMVLSAQDTNCESTLPL